MDAYSNFMLLIASHLFTAFIGFMTACLCAGAKRGDRIAKAVWKKHQQKLQEAEADPVVDNWVEQYKEEFL